MARYAENLIGNWEDDHFEPQRDVTKNIFRTDWNKLENDYQLLKDKVEANERIARADYADALVNTQRNSLNRMNAVANNLAERGLSSGGYSDRYLKADIGQKGQEVDTELGRLLANNQENVGNLLDASIGMNDARLGLTDGFLKDLADITTAKGQSVQDYAGLVADLTQSKAGRDASASVSASERELENDEQEFYRRLGILATLNNAELDANQKKVILINEYDLPLLDTESAISSYNYKQTEDKLLKAIEDKFLGKKHKKYAKELKDYTYTDLYELMTK